MQRSLATRAGLAQVDGIVFVALGLDGASLIGADDQSAARRTLATGGGKISAFTIEGVFRHLRVRLAHHIARSRAAAGQHRAGGGRRASQL